MIQVLLVLALASGAPESSADAAKKLFIDAQSHFERGDFKRALPGFERALELSGHQEILFNIGQCHRNLGDLRRSIFFFERYLESPNATAAPGVRAAIKDMRAELLLRGQTATATSAVSDGSSPGLPAVSQDPAVQLAPDQREPDPEADSPALTRRWWFWALVGVGAAAVAGGVVLGVRSGRDDPLTLDFRDL